MKTINLVNDSDDLQGVLAGKPVLQLLLGGLLHVLLVGKEATIPKLLFPVNILSQWSPDTLLIDLFQICIL